MAAATDGQTAVVDEVVTDKGYHSNQTLVDLAALDVRTYIAESARRRRQWKNKAAARDAVYANRRRIRGKHGLALLRRRSERLERPNAHLYETGGMRRTHLRGHAIRSGHVHHGLRSDDRTTTSAFSLLGMQFFLKAAKNADRFPTMSQFIEDIDASKMSGGRI